MTSRGKAGSFTDWNPMKDDFNNTMYDVQYQDYDTSGRNRMTQLDHKKLYITNLPKGLSVQGLNAVFEQFGQVEQIHISSDPNKKYAIVRYESESEARVAMMKMNRTEPLNLFVHFAHARYGGHNNEALTTNESRDRDRGQRDSGSFVSNSTERRCRNPDGLANEGGELQSTMARPIDREFHLEYEQLKLETLRLQEEQLKCKQKMMMLSMDRRPISNTASGASNRLVLPDGRIMVQNQVEKVHEPDVGFVAGAGDSNETACSCQKSWMRTRESDEGSSTPSTCVLCKDDRSPSTLSKRNSIEQSDISKTTDNKTFEYSSKAVASKDTDLTVSKPSHKQSECSKEGVRKTSDAAIRKCEERKCACRDRSYMTCDLKFRDFYSDSDDEADETNRLIQLRSTDYSDVIDDQLKLVVALAGYPQSKIGLRDMETFQRCLTDVINMQVKENLLTKVPSFHDYYMNRSAIVCICKDMETRDWVVRVLPGLQERMSTKLVLLNATVKRLCLAVLKIPRACWSTTAQDCFKLLQYFNPSLKTSAWKIYAQKFINNMECTSFLIDRVSGEIVRGPGFKNIIDYDQVEFELTGFTEIYYECLLADMEEDLGSVASRVKLLEEVKSANTTPRLASTVSLKSIDIVQPLEIAHRVEIIEPDNATDEIVEILKIEETTDVQKELESGLDDSDLMKIKNVEYVAENDEVLVWSDDAFAARKEEEDYKPADCFEDNNTTNTSLVAMSEKSESVAESIDNLIINTDAINIDSNRGIAYHRRTNYIHVANELKLAITLEGYPQNKLEGTHIRRLKHLFKEYLHKDMKSQRFANLIIPKFQDIYLSNGAVIYICDSLETKDYLINALPRFINSTALKLTLRDVTELVRYTRIVMRLPKEQANVESHEILSKLQEKYPSIKLDCWKYYSDVAGKQKRQFGVDPESLDVIKSPDFNPVYEGEKLLFRVIDRQKRDVSCEEKIDEIVESPETQKQRQAVVKNMYEPIDLEIIKTPLTRIRTNHYYDLIADDLKLYVGPVNYPDSRIEEVQFHSIKKCFENIVMDSLKRGDISDEAIPKYHDMYLFDGVIFIICHSLFSRIWIENNVNKVNVALNINLKSTEFRGAVGIVSMAVRTDKDTEGVIAVLQKQNPRLRTKYWRKISTMKTNTKLDVVLQIDKLSAQIILDPKFNKLIGYETAQFKLGHLETLINPKSSLEELTKSRAQKKKQTVKVVKKKSKKIASVDYKGNEYKGKEVEDLGRIESPKRCRYQIKKEPKFESDMDPIIIEPEAPVKSKGATEFVIPEEIQSKVVIKIPLNILPDNEDDLDIIFDILEDKNPGLNTELWEVFMESTYPSNGKFIAYVDKRSLSVINNRRFDSSVGGEKLTFYF